MAFKSKLAEDEAGIPGDVLYTNRLENLDDIQRLRVVTYDVKMPYFFAAACFAEGEGENKKDRRAYFFRASRHDSLKPIAEEEMGVGVRIVTAQVVLDTIDDKKILAVGFHNETGTTGGDIRAIRVVTRNVDPSLWTKSKINMNFGGLQGRRYIFDVPQNRISVKQNTR